MRCRLLVLLALAAPTSATADEGDWAVGLEPAVGLQRSAAEDVEIVPGGGVSGWLGLSEAAWLGLRLERHGVARPAWGAGLDLIMALDVLRLVPYLAAGLGADLIDDRLRPTLVIGGGVDYFLSPEWTLGALVRLRPVFGHEGDQLGTAHLRVGYRGFL